MDTFLLKQSIGAKTLNVTVKKMNELDALKIAASRLDYNSETGVLTWNDSYSSFAIKGRIAGCISHDGYRQIQICRRITFAHRIAWFITYGEIPQTIDHIDRNKQNNAIANLRLCNNSQNQGNRGKSKNNTSGIKGVTYDKKNGKWQAQIKSEYVNKYLGRFASKQEAAEAYAKAAERVFGEFARAA